MKPMRALLILTMLLPGAAMAAPEAVQRLTDEQVEQVLAEAAAKREAAEAAVPVIKPGIHGVMGVEVGTGGYRAAYGTAAVPVGQGGMAQVSVATETGGSYRRRR